MQHNQFIENINDNLIKACKDNDINSVKLLLSNGANIHYKNKIHYKLCGKSPIMIASYNCNLEMFELLLLNGANIHDKNDYEESPIIYASKCGDIEIFKLLLSYGANIYDTNSYGSNCIDLAYSYGNIEIVELLEKIPLTTLIIFLQELYVYNTLDFSSFIDFNEY